MIVGIGVDLEEVGRIRSAIERHGERFVRRIFTPGEVAHAEEKAHPFSSYAARFAAKEATMKALGTGLGSRGFAGGISKWPMSRGGVRWYGCGGERRKWRGS